MLDAQISARFSWWFETKTEIDAYAREGHGRAQLRKQSMVLEDRTALLFVMTPDPVRPAWFDKLDGMADAAFADRILWFSFRDLAEAIDKLSGTGSGGADPVPPGRAGGAVRGGRAPVGR